MKKIIIGLIIVSLLILSGCGNTITGKVTLDLKDKTINTGGSTQLTVKATNNGKVTFPGTFKFSADKYIELHYPDLTKLSFELLPGESIERVIEVKGFSDAKRIDSEIKVWIEDLQGKKIDDGTIILSIRK
jgi:hypothetical protein